MDLRAGAFIKQTIEFLFSSPQLISRIFWRSEKDVMDVESQSHAFPHTFEDEVFSCAQQRKSADLAESPCSPDVQSISSTADGKTGDDGNAQPTTQYAKGSCHVALHKETPEHECLALLITETMIEKIQDVIDDSQELQSHERRYNQIEREVSKAQDVLDCARDDLASQGSEDKARDIQQVIDRQETLLSELHRRKDELSSRLEIFRSNLGYSQEASQTFFENALGKTGLLTLPKVGTPDTDESPEPDHGSDTGMSQSDVDSVSATELLGRATLEKLVTLSQDFAEAQEMFTGMEAKYIRDEAMYNEAVAEGEEVPTRSEFDCMFLKYQMGLTTYLIDTEKEYEEERANAIALGAIASDWGTPSEYGSITAETTPENDLIKAAGRDYTNVLAWIDNVPDQFDEAALDRMDIDSWDVKTAVDSSVGEDAVDERLFPFETVPETPSVDDWDARPVEISDSISLIDFGEITGKNIRRWQDQVGHR